MDALAFFVHLGALLAVMLLVLGAWLFVAARHARAAPDSRDPGLVYCAVTDEMRRTDSDALCHYQDVCLFSCPAKAGGSRHP